MDLKTELEIVIQEIVNDARNKWCSHDEEEDGIKEYADNIVKSLLNDSSLKLEDRIKNKLSEAKKDLIKLRKDTEYMEKDEINWGLEIDFIKYEIAILHNL